MKKDISGLSVEIRGNRLILISRRGGYQEIDITDVFYFFKEFFAGDWKKEYGKILKSTPKEIKKN